MPPAAVSTSVAGAAVTPDFGPQADLSRSLAGLVNGMTGWNTDIEELLDVGKRTATLSRLYNLREGMSEKDDALPKRFFDRFRHDNSATGKPLDPAELDAARKWHYRANGWDERGVPTRETLEKLGLAEYAEEAAAAS